MSINKGVCCGMSNSDPPGSVEKAENGFLSPRHINLCCATGFFQLIPRRKTQMCLLSSDHYSKTVNVQTSTYVYINKRQMCVGGRSFERCPSPHSCLNIGPVLTQIIANREFSNLLLKSLPMTPISLQDRELTMI